MIFSRIKKTPPLLFCLVFPALWLFGALSLQAQVSVSGRVTDASTGQGLPFVHISSPLSQRGTLSDLDGKFSLVLPSVPDSLYFSLLGYRKSAFLVEGPWENRVVALKDQEVNLEEVVITPDMDPALRIMRLVIRNKKRNEIWSLPEFSYEGYNKLRVLVDSAGLRPDTSSRDSLLASTDFMVWESVSHADYVRPGKFRETVLASRTAGYPDKSFPLSAADLQSLTLYDHYLKVMGDAFLSPVSGEGLGQYRFQLLEVFPEGKDTLFTLHFTPKKSLQKGMEGLLFVRSGCWALESVKADLLPGSNPLLFNSGTIRQIYQRLNDTVFFPRQLNTDLHLLPLMKGTMVELILTGRSYFNEVKFESQLKGREFGEVDLVMAPVKADSAAAVLEAGRAVPLTERERNSYVFMDSLGKENGISRLYDQFYKLQYNRIALGKIDADYSRLGMITGLEWYRLGLGLYTNERLLRWASIGGYGAYGLRDKQFKYGGSATFTPFRSRALVAGLAYDHDLRETGYERLELFPERPLYEQVYQDVVFRLQHARYFDYVDLKSGWLAVSLPKNFSLRGNFAAGTYRPGLPWSYGGRDTFRIDEISVVGRWAPGEKFSQTDEIRVRQVAQVPVLQVRWRQGVNWLGGNTLYQQWDASFHQRVRVGAGNIFAWRLSGGYTQDVVPMSKMYVFRGTRRPEGNVITDVGYAFNTMRTNEFAANQYATLFVGWHWGSSPIRKGPLRPTFSVTGKAAWGRLLPGTAELHRPYGMLTAPEKVYVEAGLAVQNFVPRGKRPTLVMSTIFSQIGIGVYYRVGAYALDRQWDNIAVRLTAVGF
ncbi:MAG: carboxypeptidase-like regulatory domain-containing protein [Bacteroidia bacterium]|nr:carboxypeptidase-like regulatory domain-containing protein [Bacteroidia bacterium]